MKMKRIAFIALILMMMLIPVTAFAADGSSPVDTGDTAFNIISTALVFLMTPGLAFFYGGMVRRKNVLNTMMNSFSIIGIISIQWVLFGYTLAFGPDVGGGLLGGLNFLGFNGVGADPATLIGAANHIPHASFAMYQMMFAIITPALITGAFAERMKFGPFVAFVVLWATLVYDPLCHWVWGPDGWLMKLGAIDFAGGTVVHISSGIAGLICALVLGKRKGYKTSNMMPHNIPFVILGAGLLWFGWFGFNAGSSLHADGLALSAFVATNTAAAAALISWMIIETIHPGKPTVLGAATGAVVGLVAITPAAGAVNA
ncbi:MAG: ammonium transporter, partial [Clostridia bacterium]|nr:ammonium transporter [Clostridia bacterium]